MDLPVRDGVRFAYVDGFDGYAVGDNGTVWTNRHSQRLGPGWNQLALTTLKRGGYKRVGLRSGRDRQRQILIHRLVLTAFVGPCPDGLQGCHNDGNPANNHVSNLRWDTQEANAADVRKHGRFNPPRGERGGLAKLTNEQVREIRQSYANKELNLYQLADKFGVSAVNVGLIVRRKTWTEVA